MRRVAVWVGVIVALALLGWGALHVFISPVHPDQPSPPGHPASACWTCHFVSASADIREP
ncbi:MAG: hypothetical protein RQ731_03650 [Anaerosomatales bacterium]|nr:hypothetical protein [Anaerosomatales bacterium]MDT8433838.1 hypothetical protein [Anaerosomatales bacterium]